MVMLLEFKFLLYGKDFYVFIFYVFLLNDMEWIFNIIEELELYRFIGGCNGFYFDFFVFLFSNILKIVNKLMVLVVVFFMFLINFEIFKFYLENIIMYLL